MSCYYIPLFGNGDLKSDWNYAVFADGEEPAGALSEAEFAARFPDEPPPPPSPEELAALALSEAAPIFTARAQRQLVQTEDFSAPEYALFAAAGLFPAWTPGTTYVPGNRLVYEGVVYEVQQPVTAQEHQPPGSTGMLAVYRPLSVDAETGHEPDGGPENPYPWLNGMDVYTGKYYTFQGKLYRAKADMIPCIWEPGTPGLWQWELVE